ncbi:hypothetical protein ACOSQ3_004170 [Xanthoceras sorbifolium]
MNRAGLSTSFGSLFLLIGAFSTNWGMVVVYYNEEKKEDQAQREWSFFHKLITGMWFIYEFVPNVTLFQYLQEKKMKNFRSRGIYDKYIVKVADFRTSRSITIDHTHVTTRVQRTFGYFDPEYFRSSQFTDKSDLLNGQKPIFSTVTEEGRSLTSYFIKAMEENNLYDILDAQVKMGKEEEITAVADLTTRCLNLHGQRPTMKEVAMDFDGIPAPEKGNNVQLNV